MLQQKVSARVVVASQVVEIKSNLPKAFVRYSPTYVEPKRLSNVELGQTTMASTTTARRWRSFSKTWGDVGVGTWARAEISFERLPIFWKIRYRLFT